jgi:hypothetical protein
MSIDPSIASVVAACTAVSHAAGHTLSARGQKHRAKSPPHALFAASKRAWLVCVGEREVFEGGIEYTQCYDEGGVRLHAKRHKV